MDPGKELSRLRKEKGLSQKALAQLVGTGQDYIWDIEHGKSPGIEVASKLARVFDVPLEVFWIKYRQEQSNEAVEDFYEECYQFTESPGIEILNLSNRSFSALYGASIETLGELLSLSEKELSRIRSLGPASQREVKEKLKQYFMG